MYDQNIGPIIVFMGGKLETEIAQEDGRKSAQDNEIDGFELAQRKPRTADGTTRQRIGTKSKNSLEKQRSQQGMGKLAKF
jgi:hypothetical protein